MSLEMHLKKSETLLLHSFVIFLELDLDFFWFGTFVLFFTLAPWHIMTTVLLIFLDLQLRRQMPITRYAW